MPKLTPGPRLFRRPVGLGSSCAEIANIKPLGAPRRAGQVPPDSASATISRQHHRIFAALSPGDWSVFENPYRDARYSEVFWRPDLSREVLPLFGRLLNAENQALVDTIENFACNIAIHLDALEQQHVLFSSKGRSLQLVIASSAHQRAVWAAEAVLPARLIATRLRALKRLNDLFTYRRLRPQLYPPYPRANRLLRVLRALDASLNQAPYREIAIALYGKMRVDRDWNEAGQNLRDQVRRAVYRGRALMTGGYRDLLR